MRKMTAIIFVMVLAVFLTAGCALAAEIIEKKELPRKVRVVHPEIIPGADIDIPIVFVSRNRVANWRHVHIGPPLNVAARELTPGGSLKLRNPEGTIIDLTAGSILYDVQQPDISFDGSTIVFSAVTEAGGLWHIWKMNTDGSGLEQLTFPDRNIPIPDDLNNPGINEKIFSRYGDFGPAWLPDGRIMFSSTRYMTLSGSCGERGQNLYVLDPQTKIIARRTTERSGAMDPFVLQDGRVIFSHWIDTVNKPSTYGEGLEPLNEDYSTGTNLWSIWVMNPDATDAARYLFTFGNFMDGGGLYQPHEMSDGSIAVCARAVSSLLSDTLANGIAIIPPGPTPPHGITILGDPLNNEAPHAICPAPLPDDRLVVSYTLNASVKTDPNGIRTADYDFGLYVTDPNFSSLSLIHNDPEKDEMDAVPVYSRSSAIIPDIFEADMITDDPDTDLGTQARMTNHNVYADVLPHVSQLPSPRYGTVAYIDVYNDAQTFTTSEEFPLLKRQMPEKVGSFPVNSDGSFSIDVPADEPLLFVLTDHNGVAVKSPMALRSPRGTGYSLTHTFNGHDYLRPNSEINCAGCHKGHMFDSEAAKNARVNLAQLAKASASSEHDVFWAGAWRVNDGYLNTKKGAYGWATLEGDDAWVQLDWPLQVNVGTITIYPYTAKGCSVLQSTLTLSNGFQLNLGQFPNDGSPMVIEFEESHILDWIRISISETDTLVAGISEIVVNGEDQNLELPDIVPPAPVNLNATQGVIHLSWQRNAYKTNEPLVAGYRVYYGKSPGDYDQFADVGNVTTFLMKDLLESETTYFMAVKSYNVHGTLSSTFSNEVSATVKGPVISKILPDSGPVGGGTPITIKGDNFVKKGIHVLIGHLHARDVRVVDQHTIKALTPWHKPGPADVKIIHPDNHETVLTDGFHYILPLN